LCNLWAFSKGISCKAIGASRSSSSTRKGQVSGLSPGYRPTSNTNEDTSIHVQFMGGVRVPVPDSYTPILTGWGAFSSKEIKYLGAHKRRDR